MKARALFPILGCLVPRLVSADESPCGVGTDCQSGACALESVDPEAPRVCCASGSSYSVRPGCSSAFGCGTEYFCDARDTGTECGSYDEVCASGFCVRGKCAEEKLGSEETCGISNDCESGACALKSVDPDIPTVCCASGSSYGVRPGCSSAFGCGTKYFCDDRDIGTKCGSYDEVCASGFCVQGKCAEEKLASEETCGISNDCESGACALESVDPDVPTVCCTSGSSYSVRPGCSSAFGCGTEYFCDDRDTGIECGSYDEVCASDFCVQGKCAEEKLASEETCGISNDCESGACALESVDPDAPRVCCASGSFYSVRPGCSSAFGCGTEYFCDDRDIGIECGSYDEVCASGFCVQGKCAEEKLASEETCGISNDCESGACALGSVDPDVPTVCCTSGSSYSVKPGCSSAFGCGTKYFCDDRGIGTECGSYDEVCASGFCVQGKCAEEKLASEETCGISNDCESGACALESVDPEAPRVCCASGSWHSARPGCSSTFGCGTKYFCMGRDIGAQCGSYDEVCASGYCVCGVCVEEGFVCETGICGPDGCLAELLSPGSGCIQDDNCQLEIGCGPDKICSFLQDLSLCSGDKECSSGACSRKHADLDGPFLCCPSDEKVIGDFEVCAQTGSMGDACFDDAICESNVCIGDTCLNGKQKEGKPCIKNEHCHSNVCSNDECAPFPSLGERNAYYNSNAVCPFETLDNSDLGGAVKLRVYEDSTSRTWSSTITSEIRNEKMDSTSSDNVLRGHEVLDVVEGCGGGSVSAQRQGDQVCFSYQLTDVDNDGTTKTCKSKCIRIGSKGTFDTYDKLTTDVTGGFFGQPVVAYYFGDENTCRIEIIQEIAPNETSGSKQNTSLKYQVFLLLMGSVLCNQ